MKSLRTCSNKMVAPMCTHHVSITVYHFKEQSLDVLHELFIKQKHYYNAFHILILSKF
jgi:hypothetical protein